MEKTKVALNIDDYISTFPTDVQNILQEIRSVIAKTAPAAQETISYAMPAFTINKKPLVYFAAFKNHIGFYALPSGNEAFQEELGLYKTGRGSIQFPLNKSMPLQLIARIVEFRLKEMEENEQKQKV